MVMKKSSTHADECLGSKISDSGLCAVRFADSAVLEEGARLDLVIKIYETKARTLGA